MPDNSNTCSSKTKTYFKIQSNGDFRSKYTKDGWVDEYNYSHLALEGECDKWLTSLRKRAESEKTSMRYRKAKVVETIVVTLSIEILEG